MAAVFIDLSLTLERSVSEPEPVNIEYVTHREGAGILTKHTSFSADSFPDGMAVNLERVQLTSHSGTHVDAPWHYGPICEGEKAKAIDEVPLSWLFGPALMLDCTHRADETPVSKSEIESALFIQELTIESGDIVLINTGADNLWGQSQYFTSFRGMSLEATVYLLDLGIRVIGIDSYGFDAPFQKMTTEYQNTRNQNALWPCHMIGRQKEYCQIERLTNLSKLPRNKKFMISCFPIKLKACGAGPARVVAIIN